jgi:hypothetical protein
MEVVLKWFIVPLCLTVAWMLFIVLKEAEQRDDISTARKFALRLAVALGVVLLIAIVWFFRNWNSG